MSQVDSGPGPPRPRRTSREAATPGKAPTGQTEFGQVEMEVLEEDDILRGVPHKTIVWASHHDEARRSAEEGLEAHKVV